MPHERFERADGFVEGTVDEIQRLAAVKAFKQLVADLPEGEAVPKETIDGLQAALDAVAAVGEGH
jgi:hypothetical protein